MRQTGLFETIATSADKSTGARDAVSANNQASATALSINFYPDYNSWLDTARVCLKECVDPSSVWWIEDRSSTQKTKANSSGILPDYAETAPAASCHSNDDRWSLLYSILWRLKNTEPHLLELAGDPQVTQLRKYAKAVARDVHKMKAFVRFRKVTDDTDRYVSWFEPQHPIVEYAAPFFKRRFANMKWSILTPVGCAHWEGSGDLWFSDAVDKQFAPASDDFEEAWRVYYKSIFNPARLKISAMQSEMPKKYWKNLPEAAEIPALVQAAEAKTRDMIEQRKQQDTLHCGSRPEHPDTLVHRQVQQQPATSLAALKLEASLCTRCPQCTMATQTVFGEGPQQARIMIIGEQPGDQEDLDGAPFVGPAGQVLSAAMKRAGIDREQCYLTNAVKHFGFVPRGKKRLHKRPDGSVVTACAYWLQRELELINPSLIIYLGATAASTRFGSTVRINRDRGRLIKDNDITHLITAHPSSILRLPRGAAQNKAYTAFVKDLTLGSLHVHEASA